jgi:hypothetical protein
LITSVVITIDGGGAISGVGRPRVKLLVAVVIRLMSLAMVAGKRNIKITIDD